MKPLSFADPFPRERTPLPRLEGRTAFEGVRLESGRGIHCASVHVLPAPHTEFVTASTTSDAGSGV